MAISSESFSSILQDWFRLFGRTLPWRGVKDPYLIWVSEVILQQTRVSQGWAYYERFIATFPTVQALAEAPIDAVLKVWQGLGYYTRARNMHRAARMVVEEYQGKIPQTYKELLKLPGLGEYAAGAVASFAFREPVPAIDGNVYRILARVFGVFESPGKAAGKRAFRALCMDLIDRERPDLFNQALIDFGAIQCKPGMPDCSVCPMITYCYAAANGLQTALPAKEREGKMRDRYLHFFMLRSEHSTFIEKRTGKDIWHSLYQFPMVETPGEVPPEELLQSEDARAILGEHYTLLHVSETIEQLLSHQRLHARFYIVRLDSKLQHQSQQYERIALDSIREYQVPVMIDRYLAAEAAALYFTGSGELEAENPELTEG